MEKEKVSDVISRQAAIDALMAWEEDSIWDEECLKHRGEPLWVAPSDVVGQLPSAQPEPNYCRDCKWSWCHVSVDKHGNPKIYWRCLNWDGETEEEGYCHEWERRTDG